LRTIDDYLQIVHKTMYHFQGVRRSHSSFFKGKSVQPLQDGLDLALSQQLLCEFRYAVLVMLEFVDDGPLTESTHFDLLRCHGKHTKHLRHYLHQNIRHRRGQWDFFRIYVKTSKEIPDAFKEIE
jgi:hypothetical protein